MRKDFAGRFCYSLGWGPCSLLMPGLRAMQIFCRYISGISRFSEVHTFLVTIYDQVPAPDAVCARFASHREWQQGVHEIHRWTSIDRYAVDTKLELVWKYMKTNFAWALGGHIGMCICALLACVQQNFVHILWQCTTKIYKWVYYDASLPGCIVSDSEFFQMQSDRHVHDVKKKLKLM